MHDQIVYVDLKGRIGNNLFQLAAAHSLATRHGARVVAIPNPNYILPFPDSGKTLYEYLLPYKDTFFRDTELMNIMPEMAIPYIEPSFSYNELPYVTKIYLIGYFQSEKYFDKKLIREKFSISKYMRESLMEKYGHLICKKPVSINVRRGDYLLHPNHHPVCNIKYYLKCISLIGSDRFFLITSDDAQWCKKNFQRENFHVIDDISPLQSLYLQSMCCDHIISNSTFSWWGAWLNPNKDKKVLAPKTWFGPNMAFNDTKDLFPHDWFLVE